MADTLHGIAVKLTHLGRTVGAISIDDISDVVPVVYSDPYWPPQGKTSQIYIPFLQSVIVLYTDDTARSFEKGGISKFRDSGEIRAEFIFGTDFIVALDRYQVKGRVVFQDAISSMAVTFSTPYADDDYYLSFGVMEITVGVANVNVYYGDKTRFGFTLNISAPPGLGNSVAVEWKSTHQ